MAKPDLEDGFARIAWELLAALAVADLPKWEWVVVTEAFMQVFLKGAPKGATARLSAAEIARRARGDKKRIQRAIRSLVSARIIVKVGSCQYRFNKDYATWLDGPGTPLLTPGDAIYAAMAPAYVRSLITPEKEGTKSTPRVQNRPPREDREGTKSTPSEGTKSTPFSASPPYSEEFKKESERERACASEPGGTDRPVPSLADRITAEVFKVTEDDGSADVNTSAMLRQWISGHSEAAVLAAAYEAMRRSTGDPVRYFVGMCKRGLEEPSAVILPARAASPPEAPPTLKPLPREIRNNLIREINRNLPPMHPEEPSSNAK